MTLSNPTNYCIIYILICQIENREQKKKTERSNGYKIHIKRTAGGKTLILLNKFTRLHVFLFDVKWEWLLLREYFRPFRYYKSLRKS